MDSVPGCFVCGSKHSQLYDNISAFVKTKEAGERIVVMFGSGARLDYRPQESDRVQVKVGACPHHEANLQMLDKLTSKDNIITVQMIAETKSFNQKKK